VSVTVRNTTTTESLPALFSIVSPGVPQILSLNPESIDQGSAAQDLFVTGVNFLTTSQIAINGTIRATTFVSANELDTTLTAADLANAGVLTITVVNQDGTTSPAVSLTIRSTAPPLPRRRSAGH
jgi:hypothetical protein